MSCRVARVSGDVGKAPLLLERPLGLVGIDQRAAVRDPVGFEADEHHRLPLASLRGVDGGQLDRGRWIAKGRDPRPRRVVGGDEGVEAREAGRPAEQGIERGVILVAEDDPMQGCRVTSRGRSEASEGHGRDALASRRRAPRRSSATTRSDSTMGGIAVVCRTPAWTSASRIGVSSPRVRDRKQRLRPAAPSTAASRATPSAQLVSAVFQAVIAARSRWCSCGGTDRLGEAFAVDGDHTRRGGDDRRRAPVVRRQHHAARRRVVGSEAQDPSDVGKPPGVDRLVVVPDHEQVVLRRGEETNEPQLRRIHVLELVDADVAEARLPPEAEPRIGLEKVAGAHDEIVEVDCPADAEEVGIRLEHDAGVLGWRSALDLPGREPRVELRRFRQRRGWRIGEHAPAGSCAAAAVGRRRSVGPRRHREGPGARARGAFEPRSRSRPGPRHARRRSTRAARSAAASRLKVTTQIRSG